MPKRRPVPVRLRDWKEVYEPFSNEAYKSRPLGAWIVVYPSAIMVAL